MYKLGILETDVLYSDLIDEYRSYGTLFKHFFDSLNAPFEYRFFHIQQGEFPTPDDDCDAYLITGSKAGVYDDLPWIAPLKKWIQQSFASKRKMIGVCFGHQILAHSLGGFAAKSSKGWGMGVHETDTQSQPAWLLESSLPAKFSLIYSHQDQVEQLPPLSTRLARSDFCENAAFFIDQRVLAFQGHPEFTPEYSMRLWQRRISIIGEERYQRVLTTLSQATDAALIGQCIIAFIKADS